MPVVVISTSGTAPANYFPAVIEASLSRVPLIILTADRPNHLVGSGANQTINQQKLFGSHVRYFNDVGLPTKNFDLLEQILQEANDHSNGADLKIPPGPVHLNFPFDLPLLSDNLQEIKIPQFTFKFSKRAEGDTSKIPVIKKAAKPLIVVGPMEDNSHQEDIISIAEKIQAPILADPLSQMRYGYQHELIISHYDHFLKLVDIHPDLVIRFGRKPTSNVLCHLLELWKQKTFLIDKWIRFNDDCPNIIQAHIDTFCQNQINHIDWKGNVDWTNFLQGYEKKIENLIMSEKEYSEATIARVCHDSLQDGDQFIIGNSMPIRDVDMFTSVSDLQIDTFSNRGTSGIDGVISTALGISAAKKDRRSLLLIGDLSFYHDMNGLLASLYKINLTIVVVNNGGGGIFSFLPIAEAGMEEFSQYWTADTGLDFEKVAGLYNCPYYKTADLDNLKGSIQESSKGSGIQIIEAKTNIADNIKSHKNFRKKVEKALIPS